MKRTAITLKPLLIPILSLVFMTGCATTGDPTKGGLFWSEEKAIKRQNDLNERLSNERIAAAEKERNRLQLESERKTIEDEYSRQTDQLFALEEQLQQMKNELAQAKQLSSENVAKKQDMERKLNRLQQEVTAIQKKSSRNKSAMANRKKRITELNEEITQYLEIIANL